MGAALKYSCTALIGTNKLGIIKPDQYGYRKMLLGALNFYNSSGLYYNWEKSKAIFDNSGIFMRQVLDGNLYGELEHPAWAPGWTFEEYVRRIRRIEGSNVSHHIREIEFDFSETNSKGDKIALVYGWVKPDREKGPFLAAALENPCQNVCFSIRSLVTDRRIGREIDREITECITFDWVTEPGISKAKKWNAPGLESIGSSQVLTEMDIPVDVLRNIAAQNNRSVGLGLESAADPRLDALLARIDRDKYSLVKPSVLTRW